MVITMSQCHLTLTPNVFQLRISSEMIPSVLHFLLIVKKDVQFTNVQRFRSSKVWNFVARSVVY